jgi:DNA-binding LacI/PurR family transcriptional regulator
VEGTVKRYTLKDVALLAGVSLATASQALSDTGRVSTSTKQSVEQAAAKLGYIPHAAGRALRSQRVSALAVVLPHSSRHVFSHPTLTALLDGIVSVAVDNDLSTILSTSRGEEDEASAYRRLIQGREADGVIVASAAVADANIVELSRTGYPIVIVGRAPHLPNTASVSLDDFNGGKAATEHLLSVHQACRIVHISGPLGHQSSQDKLAGYRSALVGAAVAPDPGLEVEGDYTDESGAAAVERILQRATIFDAIFAANDQMALGAREVLKAHNIRVPEDVRLVGYDDIPLARYLSPTLTSVQGDMTEVGEMATRQLLQLMAGQTPAPVSALLPTALVTRSSCGCHEPGPLPPMSS